MVLFLKVFLTEFIAEMGDKTRSEERRVGKECRCRWSAAPEVREGHVDKR